VLTSGATESNVAWASGPGISATRPGGTPKPPSPRDVLITGVGVIVPGAVGNDAFARLVLETREPRWSADSGPIAEADYLPLLNARRVRRMSEYVKLTLAATALALRDAKLDQSPELIERSSALIGTTHGSTDFSATYYREIVRQGLVGANPVLFAEGVPNAAAAHLSLMLGVKGGCQAIIGSRTSGLDALHLAASRIRGGEWDRAIVGAGEEYSPLVNAAYEHCGLYAGGTDKGAGATGAAGAAPSAQKGFVTGSAAVTFVLESRDAAEARGVSSGRGVVVKASGGRGRPNESVESAVRVIKSLGPAPAVLTSSSATWVDRSEAAALRAAAPEAIVSSIYGHTAEHFSATPLLGLASVLLTRRLPRLLEGMRDLKSADGTEPAGRVAALCTDFTGCVSGVLISMEGTD
jgi:3-oxoacyl-(acyl-carrier-protein) synthase